MKKLTAVFVTVIMLLSFSVCAADAVVSEIPSERQKPLLVDDAGLLSESEQDELLAKLEEISSRQECEVAVVTVDTLDGKSQQDFADDYYDYNGYGYGNDRDGMMLVIAMNERKWQITTCGYGITALTDYGIQYISDNMQSDLSNGYYYDAFTAYADYCDDFITQARNGEPFDVGSEKMSFGTMLFIAIVAGFIIALIAVLVMKGKLKTVRRNNSAVNYTVDGSLNITGSRDIYLYRTTTRTAKPKDNDGGSSTHTSSSGSTHGGGGGSF